MVMVSTRLDEKALRLKVKSYQKKFDLAKNEISKILVGQDDVVDRLIQALLCNGHVLLEGIPGVGKTLLIRSLSAIVGAGFSRLQFTPDLLPTDIVGIQTYNEKKGFYTVKGPIFSNFVLGDEINRSPPKVQSALLEGMQERQVTIGKETFQLPKPFFVMATMNPLEQVGTYKLPEAQLDRFIFKVVMGYPKFEDELKILEQNMTLNDFNDFKLKKVFSKKQVLEAQELTKQIFLDEKMERYIVRLIDATRNPAKYKLEKGKYLGYGGSPRASIALYIASKAKALLSGKARVTPKEIRNALKPVLRHRIIVNFEGQALEVTAEDVIDEIIKKVKIV